MRVQRTHEIVSMKSSRITIRENLYLRKFCAIQYTSRTREDRKRVTVLECGELCHALCAHLHCLSTLKGGLFGAGFKYILNTVHTKYDSQHQLSKMDKSDQRKLSDCVEERSHDALHPPLPYSLSYIMHVSLYLP